MVNQIIRQSPVADGNTLLQGVELGEAWYFHGRITQRHVDSVKLSSRSGALLEYVAGSRNSKEKKKAELVGNLFYDFFLKAFEHQIPRFHQANNAMPLYQINDFQGPYQRLSSEFIQEILESNSTDTEKVFSLILGNENSLTSDEALARGKTFAKFAETLDLKTQDDVKLFIDPIHSQWGREGYNFMTHLLSYWRHEKLSPKFENKSFREFSYKAWAMFAMEKEYHDIPLKNVIIDMQSIKITNEDAFLFLKLPLQTEKFRQYLMGKTYNELQLLIGKIPSNTPADTAIALGEQLLNNNKQEKGATIALPTATYMMLLPKLTPLNDADLIINTNTKLFSNIKKVETIALIRNYFAQIDPSLLTKESVETIFSHLLEAKISKWINSSIAEYAIGLMRECMTPEEIITVILEVSKEQPLSLAQWKVYIENRETYKDMPANWWITLVKNA